MAKYVRSNPGGFLRALDRDQPRHDRRVRALNNGMPTFADIQFVPRPYPPGSVRGTLTLPGGYFLSVLADYPDADDFEVALKDPQGAFIALSEMDDVITGQSAEDINALIRNVVMFGEL